MEKCALCGRMYPSKTCEVWRTNDGQPFGHGLSHYGRFVPVCPHCLDLAASTTLRPYLPAGFEMTDDEAAAYTKEDQDAFYDPWRFDAKLEELMEDGPFTLALPTPTQQES